MRAAVRFGPNPLDRLRVEAPEDAKYENGNDPFDDFLGRTAITFTGHSNPLQTSKCVTPNWLAGETGTKLQIR